MSWILRWARGSGGHRHVVTLVQGEAESSLPIWMGDLLTINDAVSTFAEVELLGDRHVRITFRPDDERLTAADLELLHEPVSANPAISPVPEDPRDLPGGYALEGHPFTLVVPKDNA
jgi:hypothetical protein